MIFGINSLLIMSLIIGVILILIAIFQITVPQKYDKILKIYLGNKLKDYYFSPGHKIIVGVVFLFCVYLETLEWQRKFNLAFLVGGIFFTLKGLFEILFPKKYAKINRIIFGEKVLKAGYLHPLINLIIGILFLLISFGLIF